MPAVSVLLTPNYDADVLYRSVCTHLEVLDVKSLLAADSRVLLKPNLLAGRDPALAVTTHPTLILALVKRLHELGVKDITLADSPGGLYTAQSLRKVYSACRLNPLADFLTLNEVVSYGERNGFTLITPVLEADYIINLPKLKTHGLTVMSAGVKNLFGCIPGLRKPELHCIHPTIESFTEMLLDLSQAVKPHLTLMDAVDCMEGNGPGGGKVRPMGYTLCSHDVYAMDEVAAELMALPPHMSPTVREARNRNLCNPASIQKIGDDLLPASPPFKLPDAIATKERFFSTRGLFHHFFGRKRTYPVIMAEKCIGCGRCGESCPKHLIDVVERKAEIARQGCISCFCCQEMCPVHAIEVERRRAW